MSEIVAHYPDLQKLITRKMGDCLKLLNAAARGHHYGPNGGTMERFPVFLGHFVAKCLAECEKDKDDPLLW